MSVKLQFECFLFSVIQNIIIMWDYSQILLFTLVSFVLFYRWVEYIYNFIKFKYIMEKFLQVSNICTQWYYK